LIELETPSKAFELHDQTDSHNQRHSTATAGMTSRPRPSPWCCGSLQTGAVATAVAHLVALLLAFLWIVQMVWDSKHFFAGVVILTLVAFALAVANVSLLGGAIRRKRSLVLPWLVAHVLLALGIIVACSVTFHSMDKLRPLAVASVLLLIYFVVVVATFYTELLIDERCQNEKEDAEKTTPMGGIALNGTAKLASAEDEFGGAGDDTFTELARRNPNTGNADKETFGRELSEDEEGEETASGFGVVAKFPSPSEVIDVDVDVMLAARAAVADVSSLDSRARPRPFKAKSSVELEADDQTEMLDGQERLLQPSTAAPRPSASRSMSHSALLADISSAFTPFKSQRVEGVGTPPKMKIFLPRSPDGSGGRDDGDSTTSEEEDEERTPLSPADEDDEDDKKH